MSTQPVLFDRVVGLAKDKHGRFFTPVELAAIIVEQIAVGVLGGRQPSLVVEPSVGDGSFVDPVRRWWPDAHLVGVDVDPGARGLRAVDGVVRGSWLELAPEWASMLGRRDIHHPWMSQRPDVVLGNPPFTRGTGRMNAEGKEIMEAVAHLHVEAALALEPEVLAFILPWAYAGGVDRWEPLLERYRPAALRPIAPRPWTNDLRETALYVWVRGATRTDWDPLPRWK